MFVRMINCYCHFRMPCKSGLENICAHGLSSVISIVLMTNDVFILNWSFSFRIVLLKDY